MWEQLFREMEQAALNTDMMLYEEADQRTAARSSDGFHFIRRHTDRFVITSISRGSIVLDGVIILAVGAWFFKHFISPGWEKSASKQQWDESVAGTFDKAIPLLKDQLDHHIVHRLKRLKIRRVAIQPPPILLDQNSSGNTKVTELTYDKPKPIAPPIKSPH